MTAGVFAFPEEYNSAAKRFSDTYSTIWNERAAAIANGSSDLAKVARGLIAPHTKSSRVVTIANRTIHEAVGKLTLCRSVAERNNDARSVRLLNSYIAALDDALYLIRNEVSFLSHEQRFIDDPTSTHFESLVFEGKDTQRQYQNQTTLGDLEQLIEQQRLDTPSVAKDLARVFAVGAGGTATMSGIMAGGNYSVLGLAAGALSAWGAYVLTMKRAESVYIEQKAKAVVRWTEVPGA